ncbi:glycosyltransferase [Confluentibacter lentus]|uniref:glycosyltransferase n=1 Tax=Confluentibacter lentus TaxID=1699412 RepID=UPI000C2893B7|nr:glycosyltransferase [Confluentibacter lentus]
MKVLQIINSLSAGGAEKLLVNSVVEYRKMGIDVDILVLKGGVSPFLDKLEPFQEINVFALGDQTNVYNPLHIFKIYDFLNNYNVVHVHLFPVLYWVALADMLRIGKRNYKLVYTEHNTTNRRRDKLLFKFIDKILYRRFHKIVSISDAVDVNLRNHLGKSFDNIIKIYNGIDLKEIYEAIPYSKEALDFTEMDKLIIQVSSFTAQKDQLTLIKSLEFLPKNYFLILVGDGELKSSCIKKTEELRLSDRVKFYGIRKDVPKLLKSVDVIVLSSHFEGLSLSSVEGLASGKPFIASDVPGLTEVVEGAGLLFEDANENQLAELILKLFDDNQYYSETVNQCMARAKKFDIIKMTKEYYNLYKELSLV